LQFRGGASGDAVEDCLDELRAIPKRIFRWRSNPFSPVLENQMIPSVDRMVSEVHDMMKVNN